MYLDNVCAGWSFHSASSTQNTEVLRKISVVASNEETVDHKIIGCQNPKLAGDKILGSHYYTCILKFHPGVWQKYKSLVSVCLLHLSISLLYPTFHKTTSSFSHIQIVENHDVRQEEEKHPKSLHPRRRNKNFSKKKKKILAR